MEQKGLAKEIDSGVGTAHSSGQQQLHRAYAVRGDMHLTRDSAEAKAAQYSSIANKSLFMQQQQEAGAGCLRVRVAGDKQKSSILGVPAVGGAAGAAVPSLQDKLDIHCLVLLTWRLQNEPDLPVELDWLLKLITADAAAAPGTAGGGTASQQRSHVRKMLGGAALNSKKS
jgi:hypothetical protein